MSFEIRGWTPTAWPYNSAIKIDTWSKKVGIYIVYLHRNFLLIDPEANNGLGEWEEGDGYSFTIKTQLSGSCGSIVDLNKAIDYVEQYVLQYQQTGN